MFEIILVLLSFIPVLLVLGFFIHSGISPDGACVPGRGPADVR